jgi:hypothetical protein
MATTTAKIPKLCKPVNSSDEFITEFTDEETDEDTDDVFI